MSNRVQLPRLPLKGMRCYAQAGRGTPPPRSEWLACPGFWTTGGASDTFRQFLARAYKGERVPSEKKIEKKLRRVRVVVEAVQPFVIRYEGRMREATTKGNREKYDAAIMA